MNGFAENAGADPERRFPEPLTLVGRWARNVKTRKFVKVTDATEEWIIVVDQYRGPRNASERELTHEQFARLYNLVPVDRAGDLKCH